MASGEEVGVDIDFASLDAAVAKLITRFGDLVVKTVETANSVNDKFIGTLERGFKKLGNSMGYDLLSGPKAAWADWVDSSIARVDSLKAAVETYFPTFAAVAEKSFSAIKTSANAAWAAISGGLTSLVGVTSRVFGAMLSPVKTLFNGIVSLGKNTVSFITSAFSKAFGVVKSVVSGVYGIIQQLLPLAGIGLFAGISSGIQGLQDDEDALQRVTAAIQATGGAAGFSADQLSEMAEAMTKVSRFGGDAVMQAQANMLQFTNVRGDIFKRAFETSADAAVLWKTDITSAAEKVAMVLDDPIEGLQRLRKEGIKFTEQEKEMVDYLVEAGDIMSAQTIILDRLAEKTSGAAAKDLQTFSGQLKRANEVMEDAWKAIAKALVPAFKVLVDWFKTGTDQIGKWSPILESAVTAVIDFASKSSDTLASWGNKIQEYAMVAFNFMEKAAIKAFTFVETAIKNFPTFMEAAKSKFMLIWEQLSQFVRHTWETITVFVENLWEKALVKMAKMYTKFTYDIQKQIAGTTAGRLVLGKSKEQLDREERLTLQALDRVEKFAGRKKARGQTDDEKKRLSGLEADSKKAGDAFGEEFNKNLEKNESFVDRFKQKIKELVGLAKPGEGGDLNPRLNGDEFLLNKDSRGGGGGKGFEDLVGLQKRIAGATGSQSPEARAMIGLPGLLKQQHAENKAAKQKEIEDKKTFEKEQKQLFQKISDNLGLA